MLLKNGLETCQHLSLMLLDLVAVLHEDQERGDNTDDVIALYPQLIVFITVLREALAVGNTVNCDDRVDRENDVECSLYVKVEIPFEDFSLVLVCMLIVCKVEDLACDQMGHY